ncbi:chaperonin 10-like protein [Talaromyces proteolyticus]|uniref:Chaperonin 10-like protein n=1 Tax=Talaromyces proteolyticus TaxID=1131652 RepID=A0AAD4PWQ1_9EURO|nr:chaperonin 10-like protein [Talaromyces proteolyticus]KAH8695335.1 chaperonin 10-like protein [Talaromyces proteolyticus]
MRAVRFHGKRDIRLDRIPVPEICNNEQVKIKPSFTGLCGTDLHEYLEGPFMIPSAPHKVTGEQCPVVIGHEFSGVVTELGKDVHDLQIGDKVTVQTIIFDRVCNSCQRGLINCCPNSGFIGLSWGGGLAEYIVLPRWALFKIPSHVSLQVGALVEPLAVAWHAVKLSHLDRTDSVLVIGAGPIGLAVVQVLRARGVKNVFVSEPVKLRRKLATDFGAARVLSPLEDDVVGTCTGLTGGEGVQAVFDTAGVQSGLDTAVAVCRPRASIVNIAVWGKQALVHPTILMRNEISYVGSRTYSQGDFQEVIDSIASGALQPQSMITSVIKMEDVEQKGLKALHEDKDTNIKIIVEVSKGTEFGVYLDYIRPRPILICQFKN